MCCSLIKIPHALLLPVHSTWSFHFRTLFLSMGEKLISRIVTYRTDQGWASCLQRPCYEYLVPRPSSLIKTLYQDPDDVTLQRIFLECSHYLGLPWYKICISRSSYTMPNSAADELEWNYFCNSAELRSVLWLQLLVEGLHKTAREVEQTISLQTSAKPRLP